MEETIEEGTVIHGTLRTDALVLAFHAEHKRLDPEHAERFENLFEPLLEKIAESDKETVATLEGVEARDAFEVLDWLFDKLNEHAPEGMYFGAHMGDGSDMGFWRLEEEW